MANKTKQQNKIITIADLVTSSMITSLELFECIFLGIVKEYSIDKKSQTYRTLYSIFVRDNNTVADFLSMTIHDFMQMPGVGNLVALDLVRLQTIIKNKEIFDYLGQKVNINNSDIVDNDNDLSLEEIKAECQLNSFEAEHC